jgi:hypothetical protein
MAASVLLDQHLGAGRNPDLERLAVGAMPQCPLAVAPAPGLEVNAVAKLLEIAQRVVTHQHHVAAPAAIATVRPTLRDMRLPAKAQAAVTPTTGANVNASSILHV